MAFIAASAPTRLRDLMRMDSRLRYLVWRGTGSPQPLSIVLKGGARLILRPPPAGDLSVAHEVFLQECYRAPRQLDLARIHTIVDVGANCGFALIYFAARFPSAQLLAFEPHPAHQAQIEQHLRLNALLSRVTLMRAAAGRWEGLAFLLDQGERSQVVIQRVPGCIPIDTIDFFAALHNRTIDLLKLDCEGGEYDLIMDPRFAALDIRALVLELHTIAGRPRAASEIRRRLQESNFTLQSTTPQNRDDSCGILWAFRA